MSKRKGKGICRGGESKAGKEKSSDKEEKESEKGDEKEERSETGVGWYFYTGHLEFAAPTSRALKSLSLSSPVQLWFWSRVTLP